MFRCLLWGIAAALQPKMLWIAGTPMGPFTLEELQKWEPKYKLWISGVFYEVLLRRLSPSQLDILGDVRLKVPLEASSDPGFVLNMTSNPLTRRVIAPVRTIRWLDEYCGLIPYLEKTSCSQRTVLPLIYDAMLRLARPGERQPGPFAAFGLDNSIFTDDYVKDVSNKILNSSITFLLSHELGHLAHNRRGGLSGIWSQMQEGTRGGQARARYRGSNRDYAHWSCILVFGSGYDGGGQITHPLSGARVSAAAEEVEKRPTLFIDRLQPNRESWVPRIMEEARQIHDVVPLID